MAGHWWLTPIIFATQEVEIRKISVQSQPEEIVHKTLSQKYPMQNRVGGVAKVIECLPSKHAAPSVNPSTAKRKLFQMN
jgi:hypothetical protein